MALGEPSAGRESLNLEVIVSMRPRMPRNWRKVPWHLRYRLGAKVASELRRLVILATHRHCHVEFQGPVHLGPGFELNIPDAGTLIVGPGVDFRRRFYCEISSNGRVEIGAGSVFTGEIMIQCSTSVTIGKRVMFGQASLIADGNHRFRDYTKHLLDQGYDYRPITVGNNAVIMTKSTILNDVGEGALIAANSVVTRPIPAYCLAGGVPARLIEYFGPPEMKPEGLDV